MLAAAEIADGWAERARSLGGADFDHALVLRGAWAGHTAAVPQPLDVAFLDRRLQVVATCRAAPWRVVVPRPGGRHLVAASAGSFERWGLQHGDVLELREAS